MDILSCRLKQKSGDPSGFTAHLRKNNISPKDITRYVGNKWNLLFDMALTVIKHQSVLEDYLSKFCGKEAMRLVYYIRSTLINIYCTNCYPYT